MDVPYPQQSQQAAVPPRQVVDPGKERRKGWMMTLIAAVIATLAGTMFFIYLNQLEAEIGLRSSPIFHR